MNTKVLMDLSQTTARAGASGEGIGLVTYDWDYGQALSYLKDGPSAFGRPCRVGRKGWNGKNMWVSVASGHTIRTALNKYFERNLYTDPASQLLLEMSKHPIVDSLIMRTATGETVIGGLASQTDMLSNDWGPVFIEETTEVAA